MSRRNETKRPTRQKAETCSIPLKTLRYPCPPLLVIISHHNRYGSQVEQSIQNGCGSFSERSAVMMKTQAYFRKVTPLMLILFIYSFERQGYRSGNFRTRNSYSKYNDFIERFRVTLKANGKREFVPRDQVFSLHVFYCSFLLQKKPSFTLSSSIRVVSHYFYPLIFYFETFPT